MTGLDLDAYFARIGFSGAARADADTLRRLHLAHATHVPFENIDVLLGRPIRLDLASLEAKLVHARRGGYCFEQNALFAAVLEQIGFKLTRLLARVRFRTSRPIPRTHMVNVVEADGETWLADVGFGGWGLLEPIMLMADREIQQGVWKLRLMREDHAWVLQCPQCPLGPDQYTVTMEPQAPIDYEPANHYCATHPDSRFVQTLTAQLPALTERVMLKNRELTFVTATGVRTESLPDDAAIRRALAERFGIHYPADVELRAPTMEPAATSPVV